MATVWIPLSGNGEFTSIGAEDIVDQSGVQLVDPSGINIVSPLSTFTQLAATTWVVNDNV